ncbi:helix-turn-helix domain-containing protein [Formosa haliotis]|uniref:helix-turn-helix domain-containing protein n=1 Tax=Formosa haliotis TaxID=1555194 RepID=UPI00082697D3|nr:helix-turn-helix domain-containing protein [Formosa haliotis]
MSARIITTDELREFKLELLEELKVLLSKEAEYKSKKWLKSPEVRELLGISHGTLQNLRINGTLPYSKVGGVLYYDYHDIIKVIENHKIHNTY